MVKGQTQDFSGISGQYFRTCALCLAKAYPRARLLLTKTIVKAHLNSNWLILKPDLSHFPFKGM